MSDEVIDATGNEVQELPTVGSWITFQPSIEIPGLYKGIHHLGLVIGTIRGRPIFRIFSPVGKDATFEYTGSNGVWDYHDPETP